MQEAHVKFWWQRSLPNNDNSIWIQTVQKETFLKRSNIGSGHFENVTAFIEASQFYWLLAIYGCLGHAVPYFTKKHKFLVSFLVLQKDTSALPFYILSKRSLRSYWTLRVIEQFLSMPKEDGGGFRETRGSVKPNLTSYRDQSMLGMNHNYY